MAARAQGWRSSARRAERIRSLSALPVGTGDRGIDLAHDDVHHPVDEVILVGHVLVERHRHHAQRLRQPAHSERLQARFVGERDGGAQGSVPIDAAPAPAGWHPDGLTHPHIPLAQLPGRASLTGIQRTPYIAEVEVYCVHNYGKDGT
jgi:hypothetical protein